MYTNYDFRITIYVLLNYTPRLGSYFLGLIRHRPSESRKSSLD